MRVSREDELVEPPRLLRDGGGDARMAMAMGRHPPARNAVDQRAAIGQMKHGPLRPHNARDRLAKAMLVEGVPDGRSHARALGQARGRGYSFCDFSSFGMVGTTGGGASSGGGAMSIST